MAKKETTTQEPIEKQLWKTADKLRKNIDAAEYKHIVLGLIFLKYISDAFEELNGKLVAGEDDYAGADPEDRDEYRAENVFLFLLLPGGVSCYHVLNCLKLAKMLAVRWKPSSVTIHR